MYSMTPLGVLRGPGTRWEALDFPRRAVPEKAGGAKRAVSYVGGSRKSKDFRFEFGFSRGSRRGSRWFSRDLEVSPQLQPDGCLNSGKDRGSSDHRSVFEGVRCLETTFQPIPGELLKRGSRPPETPRLLRNLALPKGFVGDHIRGVLETIGGSRGVPLHCVYPPRQRATRFSSAEWQNGPESILIDLAPRDVPRWALRSC
jgi:hypothetical protein